MKDEDLFFMRHPNRLRALKAEPRSRTLPRKTSNGHHRSETLSGPPNHETTAERRRKWMQNFSLQVGPPLWVLLKQG